MFKVLAAAGSTRDLTTFTSTKLSEAAAALRCLGGKLGMGRALHGTNTARCSHSPVEVKLVSSLPPQVPKVLECHMGSIASCSSHYSSSCKEQKLAVVSSSRARRWGAGLHQQSCPISLPLRGQREQWTHSPP